MGLKAEDSCGCYGCFECHSYLDGGWASNPLVTRDYVDTVFDRAMRESREKLRRKGLLSEAT
jgi:hypothetical protein